MEPSDLKQHYVGWLFYRDEPWSFPVGAIQSLAYPFGISLTYTDSIPLMGILMKLGEGALPNQFQYIGLWGLLCCMLQGGIAAIIFRRWTKNYVVLMLCASIFILAPPFWARMFTHTALASQWILLLSVWFLLERERFSNFKVFLLGWSGIWVLATMIHPYFLPMIAIPFSISIILTHKKWLITMLKVVVPTAMAFLSFWLIGGFVVSSKESSGDELGRYALNLNSLYDPLGWSGFISTLHPAPTGESLAYLGLGMLLLVPIAFYIWIQKNRTPIRFRVLMKSFSLKYIMIAVVVAGITLMALSPRIQFGKQVLFELDIPQKLEQYWSIFRASARLFWIIYYLIIIGILAYIIRTWQGKSQTFLVVFMVTFTSIQMIDLRLSPQAVAKNHIFDAYNEPSFKYTPELSLSEWRSLVGDRKHFVYLDGMNNVNFFRLADVAIDNRMTMNTGYFARSPKEKVEEYQAEARASLLSGKADMTNNLYVTQDKLLASKTAHNTSYTISVLDGYCIIREANEINAKNTQ